MQLLMERVVDSENLRKAYRRVVSNRGRRDSRMNFWKTGTNRHSSRGWKSPSRVGKGCGNWASRRSWTGSFSRRCIKCSVPPLLHCGFHLPPKNPETQFAVAILDITHHENEHP